MPPTPMTRLGIALLLLLTAHAAADRQTNDHTNVIFLLADDAGYADFGFTGSTLVPTPRIDSIAHNGATLTSFYVTASVCSPSRAGLLTGRYQQRFGHEFNLDAKSERRGLGLPPEESTIADHMRARGYRTGLIGKWHLGTAEGLQPNDRGFDDFRGLLKGSRTYFKHTDGPAGGRLQINGTPVDEPDDLYVTDWMGQQAAAFIRENTHQPFFLFVSLTAPHTPMHALDPDLEQFDGVAPERRRKYAAMSVALDRAVGTVLDAVDSNGIRDNTLIVFFNDNGGATNNGSDNGPYRGMKGSKWEGGIRVPCVMQLPGTIPAGTQLDTPIMSYDLTATAIELAGGPADDAPPLDGRDLIPALTGTNNDPVHDALFWRRGPAAAVRKGPWKLLRVTDQPDLLFHVHADPSESLNLANQNPEIVSELRAALESWETELTEPLWNTGEPWRRNQLEKHRMDVQGRNAERKWP